MIYESDRNMPLSPVRESYFWARELPSQAKAMVAIRNGDTRLLAEALLEGAEINHIGTPLLLEAARRSEVTISAYLLDKKAQVNLANRYGEAPLHAASQVGNIELLDLLIEAGAQVNDRDVTLTTPLMFAVFHGHLGLVSRLLKCGADLHVKDQDGSSVLAHVRNGRAAFERTRRRSLRNLRRELESGSLDREDYRSILEQDFEWVSSVDQKYRAIRDLLIFHGAMDCGSSVEFLTIPKKKSLRPVA